MSKKVIAFGAIILLTFVYGCSTKQEVANQCDDGSSCNLEVSTGDTGKKAEEKDLGDTNEMHIAEDNNGEGSLTISSLDQEI